MVILRELVAAQRTLQVAYWAAKEAGLHDVAEEIRCAVLDITDAISLMATKQQHTTPMKELS